MYTCRLLQNSPEHWLQSNWHEKHMTFHRVSTFISFNQLNNVDTTTEDIHKVKFSLIFVFVVLIPINDIYFLTYGLYALYFIF